MIDKQNLKETMLDYMTIKPLFPEDKQNKTNVASRQNSTSIYLKLHFLNTQKALKNMNKNKIETWQKDTQ